MISMPLTRGFLPDIFLCALDLNIEMPSELLSFNQTEVFCLWRFPQFLNTRDDLIVMIQLVNLMGVFSRYLTNYLPAPSTIPVTVSLSVPERKFLVPEVVLRPDDSMEAVLRKLRSAMEKEGMRVAEFPNCQDFTISIIRLPYFLQYCVTIVVYLCLYRHLCLCFLYMVL